MKPLLSLLVLGAFLSRMSAAETKSEFLVLGGGCFWCTEAAYELLPGVNAVVSGYAGGKNAHPSYEEVCSGATGHAEVIRIEFDPAVTSLETLLDYFWQVHDPTTLNRQGADEGTQYRSIILYADEAQKRAAAASLAKANPGWGGRIVTEIKPLDTFYPAEAYHQDYFKKNPNAGYCRVVIKPKIDKLKKSPAVKAGKS
ncbi:MAG TPA: peptide-methionine (S)-S-oxide reductase MsrA [Opitutaceae bacterium]